MTYFEGTLYDHKLIPKDITYVADDACSSIGSLADDRSSVDSTSSVYVDRSQTRWNPLSSFEFSPRNLSKSQRFQEVTNQSAPKTLVAFRHPDFFPSYDMGKSLDETEEEDKQDENTNPRKLKLACQVFGGRRRRISRHSQIEMWQHQISKPFRALSFLRFEPRREDGNCLGKNVLESVIMNSIAKTPDDQAFLASYSKAEDDKDKARVGRGTYDTEDEEDLPFDCIKSERSKEFSIFPRNSFPLIPQETTAAESSSDEESFVMCQVDLG